MMPIIELGLVSLPFGMDEPLQGCEARGVLPELNRWLNSG